jgi:hypothetical protein
MHRLLVGLTILTVFIAVPTLAQQPPPARVGRVSFVSGNLAFHTAGQTEWSEAGVNYPVAAGASLWTDAEARGEIRIAADTIHLASGTELDIAELDERVARLRVLQGRIHLHLRRLDQGQSFAIEIPLGSVQLLQPGYYDIDAGSPDRPARIAVFTGNARIIGDGADIAVKAGDVALVNGANPVTATLEPAIADAFVDWCRSRDDDGKRLAAPHPVSRNITGYVELDEYGRWDTTPDYGEVWYPDVPAGWRPYTNGRWVQVAPWGWTWVDAEPWGFAPCHYGRWSMIGDNWGWVPGAFEPSPVYAPALVAFLGGPGSGLYVPGAVGPQVGWFPLAPGETYWPSYTADPGYIRSINRGSVGNIDDIQIVRNVMLPAQIVNAQFANRRFATVVPRQVFAGAGNVGAAVLHPAGPAIEHAPVTMRSPPVIPAVARGLPGPPSVGMRGPQSPLMVHPQASANTQGSHPPAQPFPTPTTALHAPPQPSPQPQSLHTHAQAVRAPGPAQAPDQASHPPTPAPPSVHALPPATQMRSRPEAPPPQAFHTSAQPIHPRVQVSPPAQGLHAPAQAPPPPQAFPPTAHTLRAAAPASAPTQAVHSPAQVPRSVQAPHAPAPAFHTSPQPVQQAAHAPQVAKGGGAPPQASKGGGPAPAQGGKGDKHD